MRKPSSSTQPPLPRGPDLFPSCDGQPVTRNAVPGPMGRIKLQFLEAFHQVNLAYARLLRWRARHPETRPSPQQNRLLREIEKAILHKEHLEDRYAVKGIVATPTYRHGFTIDVQFHHPSSHPPKFLRAGSSASRFVTLSLPPGVAPKR